MAALEIPEDFDRNPKSWRAARALGISTPTLLGHIVLMWSWCLSWAKDGDITHHEEIIADCALWKGDGTAFVDALLNCGPGDDPGFLTRDENGRLLITDWFRIARSIRPGRLSQDAWEALRLQVFIRDKYTCRYCGSVDGPFHCDHIQPVVRGGTNDMDNLATACQTCNLSKGSKTLNEWLASRGVDNETR